MGAWAEWLLEVVVLLCVLAAAASGTPERPRPTAEPLTDIGNPITAAPAPVVATERAWDCFFDREPVSASHGYPTTRCGWHGETYLHVKLPAETTYRVDGGSAGWRGALEDVLAEISTLTGIRFIETAGDAPMRFTFADALEVDCNGRPRHGCGTAVWFNRAGEVVMAGHQRVHAALLRHELLHAMGFVHATRDSILVDQPVADGMQFTEQDREMLRLYGALWEWPSETELRERACVGSGDVCERRWDDST